MRNRTTLAATLGLLLLPLPGAHAQSKPWDNYEDGTEWKEELKGSEIGRKISLALHGWPTKAKAREYPYINLSVSSKLAKELAKERGAVVLYVKRVSVEVQTHKNENTWISKHKTLYVGVPTYEIGFRKGNVVRDKVWGQVKESLNRYAAEWGGELLLLAGARARFPRVMAGARVVHFASALGAAKEVADMARKRLTALQAKGGAAAQVLKRELEQANAAVVKARSQLSARQHSALRDQRSSRSAVNGRVKKGSKLDPTLKKLLSKNNRGTVWGTWFWTPRAFIAEPARARGSFAVEYQKRVDYGSGEVLTVIRGRLGYLPAGTKGAVVEVYARWQPAEGWSAGGTLRLKRGESFVLARQTNVQSAKPSYDQSAKALRPQDVPRLRIRLRVTYIPGKADKKKPPPVDNPFEKAEAENPFAPDLAQEENPFERAERVKREQQARKAKAAKAAKDKAMAAKAAQNLGRAKTRAASVTIECWDHGNEDGDRVAIRLNGRELRTLSLLNSKTRVTVNLAKGSNALEIRALNVGSSGPNTASFEVRAGKDMLAKKKWELRTGQNAVLVVIRVD